MAVNVNIYITELTQALFTLLDGNVAYNDDTVPVYSFTTDVGEDYTILIHPIEASSGANCRDSRSYEYSAQIEAVARFRQRSGSQVPSNSIASQIIELIEASDFQVTGAVESAIKVLVGTTYQVNSDGQYVYFRNIIRYNIQLTQ